MLSSCIASNFTPNLVPNLAPSLTVSTMPSCSASVSLTVVDSSHPSLELWDEGIKLSELCYEVTQNLSFANHFGLSAQIRWAATLIPANVAEGYGRGEIFQPCLQRSYGALLELKTHLQVACHVHLLSAEAIEPLLRQCEVVGDRLRALMA